MFKGFFVTGTDTGVGKTIVTAALVKAINSLGVRACGMKPIESGCGREGKTLIPCDSLFLQQISHMKEPRNLITPYCFESPLAPLAASRQEDCAVNIGTVKKAFYRLSRHYEIIVVEGLGGLMVPITRDYFVADLASELNLPLVIVARPGLGTINHTMLTVNYALDAGLEIAGIIINFSRPPENSPAEKTNQKILSEICPAPMLGIFPYMAKIGETEIEKIALRSLDIRRIRNYIRPA
jgi:dethiobiotin synthetase